MGQTSLVDFYLGKIDKTAVMADTSEIDVKSKTIEWSFMWKLILLR